MLGIELRHWRRQHLPLIWIYKRLVEDENDVYEGANFGLFAASVLQRTSHSINQRQFSQSTLLLQSFRTLVTENLYQTDRKEDEV